MSKRDLLNNIVIQECLASVAPGTGEQLSAAITLQGFNSVCIEAGSVSTAAGTFTLTESDATGGTYTLVDGADVVGGTNSYTLVNGTRVKAGYLGTKNFLKIDFAITTDGVIHASAIKGDPDVAKVTA